MNTGTETSKRLRADGYALMTAAEWLQCWGANSQAQAELHAMSDYWSRLALDRYLKDGGTYRSRRHDNAIYTTSDDAITRVPYRAHYQPTTYNALHGGILRWFEQIEDGWWQVPAVQALLAMLGKLFASVRATDKWHIEAHQFRIDASKEIGKPTPEGAHRDGVDFVALMLIDRINIDGGVTTIYDNNEHVLMQTTLAEPFTLMLLDDTRVTHETTQLRGTGAKAYRDTLVLTYRADGFMAPQA